MPTLEAAVQIPTPIIARSVTHSAVACPCLSMVGRAASARGMQLWYRIVARPRQGRRHACSHPIHCARWHQTSRGKPEHLYTMQQAARGVKRSHVGLEAKWATVPLTLP